MLPPSYFYGNAWFFLALLLLYSTTTDDLDYWSGKLTVPRSTAFKLLTAVSFLFVTAAVTCFWLPVSSASAYQLLLKHRHVVGVAAPLRLPPHLYLDELPLCFSESLPRSSGWSTESWKQELCALHWQHLRARWGWLQDRLIQAHSCLSGLSTGRLCLVPHTSAWTHMGL